MDEINLILAGSMSIAFETQGKERERDKLDLAYRARMKNEVV
jgi:hypothetical protein